MPALFVKKEKYLIHINVEKLGQAATLDTNLSTYSNMKITYQHFLYKEQPFYILKIFSS